MERQLLLPDIEPGLRADLKRAIEAMPASQTLGLQVLGFGRQGVSIIEMPVQARCDLAPASPDTV